MRSQPVEYRRQDALEPTLPGNSVPAGRASSPPPPFQASRPITDGRPLLLGSSTKASSDARTLEAGQDDRKGLAHFPDPCLASHAGPAPACICLARQPITPLARRQTRQEIAKLFWAPSGPSWCPIAVSPGPHLLYAGPALPWLGPFYSVRLHKTALGLCASTLQARCIALHSLCISACLHPQVPIPPPLPASFQRLSL